MNEGIALFGLIFLICGFVLFIWIIKLIAAIVRYLNSKSNEND